MMRYVNNSLRKIDDKISFWKHIPLQKRYFTNGLAENSFHDVIAEF